MVKNILFIFLLICFFASINCSSSTANKTSGTPGGKTTGTDNISPPGPNWSIYYVQPTEPSAKNYDPEAQYLWSTDITGAKFIEYWGKETIYQAAGNNFFSGIGQTNWAAGINTLKGSTFKTNLPTITKYTCYDRNQKDADSRAINSNCFVDGSNTLTCNLLYKAASGAQSKPCVITTPGDLDTPAQFATCEAQDVNLGTVGCYPDRTGPNPDSSHNKGFYCTGWKTTEYDLTKVNQVLKNIRNNNVPYGCMAPVSVMTADTAWGGLGIGSSCTAEDPGITNVGAQIKSPTYLDPVLTYANPFTDDQVSGIAAVDLGPTKNVGQQFKIWNSIQNFCKSNTGFCQLPTGASRPGLAHVFGRAGPVALTEYVNLVKTKAPNDYSWQYDDGPALIQCDQADTKLVIYLCSDTNKLASFPATPTSYPAGYNSRLAIVNNCTVPVWVQQKTVSAVQPNISPKAVNSGSCVPSSSTDLSCDFLVNLAVGQAHIYNTPTTGIQSLNMSVKTGCQADGYHCVTGETVNNPNRPGYDGACPDTALKVAGVCQPNLGPQPDIETKMEGTFGCAASITDRTTCAKTQNGQPLASSTFVDTSFVDGITWVVGVQVFKTSSETVASCRDHSVPQLTLDNCPTAADLSTRPNG